SAPCCALLTDGSGACSANPSAGEYLCRCTSRSECNAACGPNVDISGNPVGPNVCKANDGAPYNGCNGTVFCGSGTCCFRHEHGNLFCARQCANDSQCGAAHCRTYDNSNTICSGNRGCGP